jgi:hypothetical protein
VGVKLGCVADPPFSPILTFNFPKAFFVHTKLAWLAITGVSGTALTPVGVTR